MEKKEHISSLDMPAFAVFLLYVAHAAIAFVGFGILWYFAKDRILVDVWQYVKFDSAGLFIVPTLILFGWAVFWAIFGGRHYHYESKATLVGRALWVSANAGFWEELLYRGLAFMGAMVMIPLMNFVLLGFAGLDIVNWFYQTISIPLANFFTFGLMTDYIYTSQWIVGAALVSAAAQFSDAHEHLGWFGRINSWFIGMFLFWIMFNYGLITGMVIHFIYDAILLVVAALKSDRIGLSWLR